LSFVFGSALFSVVLFRKLPELNSQAEVLLIVKRELILIASLFAMFCASLEVARVGIAFSKQQKTFIGRRDLLHCMVCHSEMLAKRELCATMDLSGGLESLPEFGGFT
jgi:hypothetical protein